MWNWWRGDSITRTIRVPFGYAYSVNLMSLKNRPDGTQAQAWVHRIRAASSRLPGGLSSDTGRPPGLALDQDQPVGFASSYLDVNVIDLCNLGVAESYRRRGIGRDLIAARLADAASCGATTVASAPSREGWRIQQALGFRRVPVIADRFADPRQTGPNKCKG
jgi:ribosomal protein S18 acetylase RimI-like enzyme